MPAGELKIWLKQKRQREILSSALYAAVTIICGAVLLGLMFWLVFMAVKVVLLSGFPMSHLNTAISLLVALTVCGLVFADSLYANRDDMSFLPGWLLREYIDLGPRLILEGCPHIGRARRLARLELEICANVLMFLAARNAPTPQQELLRTFPELDWSRLVAELQLIPGVMFFRPDSTRVTLTLPLRLELRNLRTQARKATVPEPEPEPEPVSVNAPQKLSPAEILGVASTASLAEIKTAYRTRIKECHPDRFAGMDEQSRTLAEEWTKSLNAAYEILVTQARAQKQT
jgi:hypothetical protein